MIDRREQILERLIEILETIPGIVLVSRNRETISAADRPAIIMHDASESTAALSNRPLRSPNDMMTLTPQIFILMGGPTETVGTQIGVFRALMYAAVYGDATLRNLVGGAGGGGDIHYSGCGLDTTPGERREARLEMNFEITYPLLFNELTAP